MNSRNSNGPSTLLCGTPEVTCEVADAVPSTDISWVRLLRNTHIHLWVVPVMPELVILYITYI